MLAGSKGDFRHISSSKQHANGCLRPATYDFLLVIYSDLSLSKPLLNHSCYSQQKCNPKQEKSKAKHCWMLIAKYVAMI